MEDRLKDTDSENKDLDDDDETGEKKENELLLGRKSKPKEKKIRKQEDSDKDSEAEEEKSHERYIVLSLSQEAPISAEATRLEGAFALGAPVPLVSGRGDTSWRRCVLPSESENMLVAPF